MKQSMEQTGSQYVKGKTCHACNSKHIIMISEYQHDFLRCQDCDYIVEPKCDSCSASLKLTKESYICCEKCGGFEGFRYRSWLRAAIEYHEYNIEKAKVGIKEAEMKIKEDKKSLKNDKKNLKEAKKQLKDEIINKERLILP